MKVTITKEAKQYLTLAEMSKVREIIAACKADESTVKEYASIAANFICERPYCNKILEATAEIVRHNGYEYSDTNSGIDVWVNFTAYSDLNYFVVGGIYLSDIWQIGNEDEHEAIKSRMYISRYLPNKQ
ncbi:MAG: hypothetical protein NC253_07885 [Ruminococcus sp.]|nr:hypothetical protein [Ruminococcus sp.]MCM1480751.1 hypothetical protein [Muribaculaceae bacterium]